jgi:hypothetical protein
VQTQCDVFGEDSAGPATVLCRLLADHPDAEGAQIFVREHGSAISHMAVGTTLGLAASVRPVQRITGFLIPKCAVTQAVTVDGEPVGVAVATDAALTGGEVAAPAFPPAPRDADPALTVPLIRLAWARSGDKGNLFNVAVIAREAEYLPYIAAALTAERVGAHYGRVLGQGGPLAVEAFSAPGLNALNFVVMGSMDGGVLASTWIDPVAKGMAQLLLDYPIPVSEALVEKFAD